MDKEHEHKEYEYFKEGNSDMNNTNESKVSKGKTKEALIISLLSKEISLKVTKGVILSINTYKQDMIEVGNKGKKKIEDGWNYCNNMPMLSLFGGNHRLPLFHMADSFIWINDTKNILTSLQLDI